jgi:hypothetical protein
VLVKSLSRETAIRGPFEGTCPIYPNRRLNSKSVETDFGHAMEDALKLAKSEHADYLPGWCGRVPED